MLSTCWKHFLHSSTAHPRQYRSITPLPDQIGDSLEVGFELLLMVPLRKKPKSIMLTRPLHFENIGNSVTSREAFHLLIHHPFTVSTSLKDKAVGTKIGKLY